MELNPEECAKVESWLKSQGEWKCELCGFDQWTYHGHLFQLAEYTGAIRLPQRKVMPLVVVACGRCYNSKLFSAIKLGLAPEQNPGQPNADDRAGEKEAAGNG